MLPTCIRRFRADLDARAPDGVIFAQGSRFGGHTLYVKDGSLRYCYNFLGADERTFVSDRPLPTGPLTAGVDFTKEGEQPQGVAHGTLRLFSGDQIAHPDKAAATTPRCHL
ncbi:hypothetical protein HD597_002934 [Nonomuraea thailandensis]|uniref:Uncharacterized protein n=1 Tax=Nonomuraea thailandensis TaxID=1188745 RepID=A0A9X2K119_9ACTN|nr:hypothetical protein [Nonomuraea thailandensis]MCP2355914.1 hypothetical protein [Nonomuraea thailandensis]